MPELKFSNTKPRAPGWYWYEDKYFGPAPVKIGWTGFVYDPDASQLDFEWPEDDGDLPLFEDATGRWAGPIEEPEDAKDA